MAQNTWLTAISFTISQIIEPYKTVYTIILRGDRAVFCYKTQFNISNAIQRPIRDMKQLYKNKPTNTIRTAKGWYSGNVLHFYYNIY
jgi:hypothetical protein